MKDTQIVKEEIKLSLLANDIILNIDNPKARKHAHASMRTNEQTRRDCRI